MIVFLTGWLCGAITVAVIRYAIGSHAEHQPAAQRLLDGERFPLALTNYEGE